MAELPPTNVNSRTLKPSELARDWHPGPGHGATPAEFRSPIITDIINGSSHPPRAVPPSRTEKLLAAFLDRENAATALNYRRSLLDFEEFCRCGAEIQAAIDPLPVGTAITVETKLRSQKHGSYRFRAFVSAPEAVHPCEIFKNLSGRLDYTDHKNR